MISVICYSVKDDLSFVQRILFMSVKFSRGTLIVTQQYGLVRCTNVFIKSKLWFLA